MLTTLSEQAAHYRTIRARLFRPTTAVQSNRNGVTIRIRDVRPYDPNEGAGERLDQTARLLAEAARRDERLSRLFGPRAACRIIAEVCAKHGLDPSVIPPGSRVIRITRCRQEVAYRLVAETSWSYPEIGRRMGGFDHTTVLHGMKQHARRNGLPVLRRREC